MQMLVRISKNGILSFGGMASIGSWNEGYGWLTQSEVCVA
jgi:hypothetical protein